MKIQMEEISNRVTITKIEIGSCCRLGSDTLFVFENAEGVNKAVNLETGFEVSITNDTLVFPVELEAKGLTRY